MNARGAPRDCRHPLRSEGAAVIDGNAQIDDTHERTADGVPVSPDLTEAAESVLGAEETKKRMRQVV